MWKYIKEKKLEKSYGISSLQTLPTDSAEASVHLIVDGVKLLLDMEKAVRKAEPLSAMTSALPTTLYTCVQETNAMLDGVRHLCNAESKKFKLLIVFGGCGYTPTARPIAAGVPVPESILKRRATEENGMELVDRAAKDIYANRFYIEEDIEAFIVRYFHQLMEVSHLGEVMRAPYLCWSQISGLFAPSHCHASEVYGSIELLAFPGIKRVITSFDLATSSFKCVDKTDLLESLQLSLSPLTEENLSKFLLISSRNRDFFVDEKNEAFIEIMETGEGDAMKFIAQSKDNQCFLQRSLAALEAPVLTQQGEIKLLRDLYSKPAENNIRKNFGKPLSPAMFFLLASGPLIPAPFASVSQHYLLDQWPLVDSKLYRAESEFIISLRAQTLHHLNLSKEGRGDRRLNWQREYNMRNTRTTTIAIPSATELCQWEISKVDFPSIPVYFENVLSYTDRSKPPTDIVIPDTIATTVAVILLRTIDLLGYISHCEVTSSKLSQIGTCLQVFDCGTLSEYGLLFIELLRTQTLTDEPIAMSLKPNDAQYPAGARFAARLLSIVHINSNGPWTGPIDPEIAAFGSCSRVLCRTLRCLTEAVTANIFFKKMTALPLDQFPEVVKALPFHLVTEFNAGIVIMHMIQNPNATLESMQRAFPQLYCLQNDLMTLRYFWEKASQAFQYLCDDPEEQANFLHCKPSFMAANELLLPAFDRVLASA